jgi:serine/threonine-protein kinase HipA
MADAEVEVVVQIAGEDLLAGRLWSHRRHNIESATFSYTPEYVARSDAYELDPMLHLSVGQHQTPLDRAIFAAFSDCAPDRWGRRLIAQSARGKHDAQRSFGEIDYLLGVRDDLRQGALRFRDPASRRYLAEEATGVPSLIELSALLSAAERLERDEASEDELRALLRGGSSLGGARPKAHVLDANGNVAIAKFPSNVNDRWDVIRWEAVALQLARAARIRVQDSTLHVIDQKPVLVVDRFDRNGTLRIGYVSAMTMLEGDDGAQGSYLEMADIIELHSPDPHEDLRELWRRIAFSILICNTDDHLRNHGFLRTNSAGWRLSPAFDLNPDPSPGLKRLSTAIDAHDTTASVATLMNVASYFRLDDQAARLILGEVISAVGKWRMTAEKVGLTRAAIERMAPAFEHAQATRAYEIAGAVGALSTGGKLGQTVRGLRREWD